MDHASLGWVHYKADQVCNTSKLALNTTLVNPNSHGPNDFEIVLNLLCMDQMEEDKRVTETKN